jgi:hypothetical protein
MKSEVTIAPPPPPKAKPAKPRKRPMLGRPKPKPRKKPAPRALKPMVKYVLHQSGVEDRATIDLVTAYCAVALGHAVTFAEKQHDYGPQNIGQGGTLGVVVRTNDKVQRLLNLAGKPAKNESKMDSARDTHVYGGILSMMLMGLWPDVTPNQRLAL